MLPSRPMADLSEIVRAHQPNEMGAGKAALERGDRIRRVAGAEPRLDVGDLDARILRQRRGRGEALGERRHAAHRLQRILRRDQPPDLIEREPSQRLAADMEMAAIGRVQRTAEEPDAAPAPIAERARERQDRAARLGFAQGRTWPSPRTTYL